MRPQKIKILVTLLLTFTFFGIAGIYIANRLTGDHHTIRNIEIDTTAVLMLNQMQQTSSRDGIKEWELKAQSARLLRDKRQAILKTLTVVFHLTDGGQIHATANEGTLFTDTHDMILSGNVKMTYLSNTLFTEQLHYEKKRHIIYSKVSVTITDTNSSLQADSLHIDLNRQRIEMKGNVKGYFSDDLLSGETE